MKRRLDAARSNHERSMSRYVVKFFKRVLSGNGHEVEVCQRWFEADAPDKAAAIEQAKKKFCDTDRLSCWSAHADRVQAVEADFPS